MDATRQSREERSGRRRDLATLALYCGGYLSTLLLPNRLDPRIIAAAAGLFFRLRPGSVERFARVMHHHLGAPRSARDLIPDARDLYRLKLEGLWIRIRALRRRDARVRIRLEGLERLAQAAAAGRGVILWRTRECDTIIPKIALWRAGVRLVHLSVAHHGTSSRSGLAPRLLARLVRRTEDRYLAERVVILGDGSVGFMRRLVEVLAGNGIVSIVGEAESGRKFVTRDFLRGSLDFPTGSPSLAWKLGSPLLPVHADREGALSYRVVIGEPIAVERGSDRGDFERRAIEEFSHRLEGRVSARPGNWTNWHRLVERPRDPGKDGGPTMRSTA